MSNYKAAFDAMAADIGAIIALLGFDRYPGVDPVLRAITDLVLAKAETDGLRAERDVALAAVAQLHSMLGVTDQVQAGERLGFLVGQSIMVPKLEAKLAELEKQEPVALANRGLHAFWVKWTEAAAGLYGPGIKLFAHPAAKAGQVPEGWRLVPTDPTSQMTFVGQSLRYDAVNSIGEIYRQMIAAAPAQGE